MGGVRTRKVFFVNISLWLLHTDSLLLAYGKHIPVGKHSSLLELFLCEDRLNIRATARQVTGSCLTLCSLKSLRTLFSVGSINDGSLFRLLERSPKEERLCDIQLYKNVTQPFFFRRFLGAKG